MFVIGSFGSSSHLECFVLDVGALCVWASSLRRCLDVVVSANWRRNSSGSAGL
jgi:hypothetical protein